MAQTPVQPLDNVEESLTHDELMFGLSLLDPLLFIRLFFSDESSMNLEPSEKQKLFILDTSKKRLCCTGRKTGKTINIERFIIQTGVTTFGRRVEGMVVTPKQTHMDQLIDRVEHRMRHEPLFDQFLISLNRGSGKLEFPYLSWLLRIEGENSGRNMIGGRAEFIVGDEMAYGYNAAYNERLSTATVNAIEMYCGVPNGDRNTPFYRLDQTEAGRHYSRHHLTSYDNPVYQTEAGKQKLINDYNNDTSSQEYITQVLGEWGMEAYGMVDPKDIHRDPALADMYREITLSQEDMAMGLADPMALMPIGKPPNVEEYIIGMDTAAGGPDPWVWKIFYRQTGDVIWKDLARITMNRTGEAYYVAVFLSALNEYFERKIAKVCVDAAGYGKALMDYFIGDGARLDVSRGLDWNGIFLHANFQGRTEVHIPALSGNPPMVQSIGNKQFMTMTLLAFMRTPIMVLTSNDDVQVDEMLGTTTTRTANYNVVYHPAQKDNDHITDALRCAAKAIKAHTERPYLALTASVAGWVAAPFGLPAATFTLVEK